MGFPGGEQVAQDSTYRHSPLFWDRWKQGDAAPCMGTGDLPTDRASRLYLT